MKNDFGKAIIYKAKFKVKSSEGSFLKKTVGELGDFVVVSSTLYLRP
jgi:hypothetical protein